MRRALVIPALAGILWCWGCGSDTTGTSREDVVHLDAATDMGEMSEMPRPPDLLEEDQEEEDGSGDLADDPGGDPAVDLVEIDQGPDAADGWADPVEEVLEDPADEEITLPACPSAEDLLEPAVGGTLYRDQDESSDSLYAQTITAGVDEPLAEVTVTLVSAEEERSTESCPDGAFSFGEVAEGIHLLDVRLEDGSVCTSTNSPIRFPEAVREGQVTIVTFGDSIPCFGATPTFPEHLATLVGTLAEVDNVNVAVAGTMTVDWMPGSNRFENRLEPELDQADVVVMSLGGNDLQIYFDGVDLSDPQAVLQAVAGFPAYQRQIEANLVTIIEEIQALAPAADVVYVMYPNFAHSSVWAEYAGEYIDLVISYVDRALNDLRANMSAVEDIVLADLYAATAGLNLDTYLLDGIHLSAAGTLFWAREVFLALGGVMVGDESLGLSRLFGYGPIDSP
ncbi:MAG: SGNH/GDSL hydrolase family protein [Bradymonadales bacterium]|nr:SGNH/GDSL hydrolase family protein [Bradymonadales bacterium]